MHSHTNMYSYDSVTMHTKQHVINTHVDITDQLNYTSGYNVTYLAFFKASLLLQYHISTS